jgi:hypothetical protein
VNILHIGLQNFGGFTTRFDDPLDDSFREWITTELFDGLGQWVWTLYPGKDNHCLRVFTAYWPCYKGSKGLENVHAQHHNYYNTHFPQQNKMPREEIMINLTMEVEKWIQAGEHVILMMDCNEDVCSP